MTRASELKFALGDRVRFTGTVAKTYEDGDRTCLHRTRYVETDYPSEPVEGVIIGWRTVIDGETIQDSEWSEWTMSEVNTEKVWCPDITTSRRVWLVAYHLRFKHVMCFEHQLERITE